MRKFNVAIARFPRGGWEHTDCVEWLVKVVGEMKKDDRIDEIISLRPPGETPITALRNLAVVQAKQKQATHLLMIDSDMSPDLPYPDAKPFWSTAWEFLMKRRAKEDAQFHDPAQPYTWAGPEGMTELEALMRLPGFPKPATIAAPYGGPPPSEYCYVFHWASQESDNPNPDFRLEMIPRETAAIASGIQEVAALPTGLILYDMRVFDILRPPWYRYEFTDETESQKSTTEDVYQTRNASLLGLPQYCAWDCWSGHHKNKRVGKPQIVTRDSVRSQLRDAVLRGVDSGDRLITLPEPTPSSELQKLNSDPEWRKLCREKMPKYYFNPDLIEVQEVNDDDRI